MLVLHEQNFIIMKLKIVVLFLVLFSFSRGLISAQSASNFIYSGRVDVRDSRYKILSGPASTIEFQFTGNSAEVKIKNIPHQGYYNYISVEMDGEYLGRYKVDGTDFKPYVFASKKKAIKNHRLVIYKATESMMGEVAIDITGISAEPVANSSKKKIEFIGDSITCGFGNDETGLPCGQGQWFDQHNAYYAYGPVVSRMLGAEFLLSSVSGYGMYRNWNSEKWEEDILPDVYDYLYLRRSASQPFGNEYQPDLVSICLGTNDLSDGDGKKQRLPFNRYKYIGNYIEFIQKVYQKYPHTQIVLLNSPMVGGERNQILVECLKEVKNFFQKDVQHKPIEIFEFSAMKPTGCGYHPSIEDDKKMAEELYPFYKKILKD